MSEMSQEEIVLVIWVVSMFIAVIFLFGPEYLKYLRERLK